MRISPEEWQRQKSLIERLYLEEGRSRDYVMNYMVQEKSFHATKAQYERQFSKWGWRKHEAHISEKDWKKLGYAIGNRVGNGSGGVVRFLGKPLNQKRVERNINRYRYNFREQQELKMAGPPSPFDPRLTIKTPPPSNEASHDLWLTHPQVPAAAPAHRAAISLQFPFPSGSASPQLATTSTLAFPLPFWPIPASLEERMKDLAHRAGHLDKHTLTALRREQHWISQDVDLLLPVGSLRDDHLLHDANEYSMSAAYLNHCLLNMLFYLVSNNLIAMWHGDFCNVLRQSGIMQLDCDSDFQRYSTLAVDATMRRIFEEAILRRHADILSWLFTVKRSPDTRIRMPPGEGTGTHLPLVIVMSDRIATDERAPLIKLLLSRGASLIKKCCAKHQTPLQYALSEGNAAILEAIASSRSAGIAEYQFDSVEPVEPVIEIQDDFVEEWLNPDVYNFPDEDEAHGKMLDFLKFFAPSYPTQQGSVFWLSPPDMAIRAAKFNNHVLLREISRHGLPMDCHNEDGEYPLAMAVGSVETTRLLLSLGASPEYCTDRTPPALHCAIQHHDPGVDTCMAVCEILLENGAGINTRFAFKRSLNGVNEYRNYAVQAERPESVLTVNTDEYAPLEVAVSNSPGNLFMYRFLMERGAEVDIGNVLRILEDINDTDALEYFADEYGLDQMENMPGIIKVLLEKGIDLLVDVSSDERGPTILDLVMELCHRETLQMVVDAGVPITPDTAVSACESGLFRTSAYLWQRIPDDLKCQYDAAFLTIITAIGQRNFEQLGKGLSDFQRAGTPDRKDIIHLLSLSLRNADCQIVHLILQSFPQAYSSYVLCIGIACLGHQQSIWGAVDEMLKRRRIGPMNKEGEARALHLSVRHALRTNDFRAVEHFCQNDRFWEYSPGPRYTIIPQEHWTMALNESKHRGTPEQLERLIKLGFVPSVLLFLSLAQDGQLEHLEVLLAHGFDPNKRYLWSPTALELAVGNGYPNSWANIRVVQLLLKSGADASCSAARHCAPRNAFKHIKCLEWTSDRDVFQSAVEQGNIKLLKLLLNHGANVNGPAGRRNGATALQIACIRGYTGIVQFLLSRRVDIDAPGGQYRGRTALEAAAEHGRLEIMHLLLAAGCQISGDHRKQYIRAVGFAQAEGHEDVARELKRIGHWQSMDDELLSNENLVDEQTPTLFREWEDPCKLCSENHGNGHPISCKVEEDCELSYAPVFPEDLETSFWPYPWLVERDEKCWMNT